ncbi:cobalamin-dependent protein [Arenibaculum sp.]|uniref:cobalamin-dependent protein n=1 Tax=Arenibaculum sp. TaxID=2865862 RepID=UPI002E143698|nr:cobalamin-dependent protein [Arenibaculum sp.]HEV7370415.1 cobalamin-dependent protein [Arenibaculum sp.]
MRPGPASFTSAAILPEPGLLPGRLLLDEGAALARDWRVVPGPFLRERGASSEVEVKRASAAAGRIMHHAQVGFRDPAKSRRAYGEIHARCAARGVTVDRYGLCLDWSMGYPAAERPGRPRGTGMILAGVEDFVALTAEAPVAPHFGDFVLGFPAAVENTCAALAAGATAIGNLGQFFTFRLPHWDDDVALTEATVRALGLLAAQPVPILVHSNLDDGFAAQFTDLACALGAAMIERHVVEGLIGGSLLVGHCFGHHFSDPVTRLAFQRALARVSGSPGTMLYGNTVAYQGSHPQNFASLGSYLLVDILGQWLTPTGHAINPVPVTENERIPDIDEIVDAQLHAGRLVEHAADWRTLIDPSAADRVTDMLVEAGTRFRDRVLAGLAEGGIDVDDPFHLLLALRRIGGARLESRFGPGREDAGQARGREPVVPATTFLELMHAAEACLARVEPGTRGAVAAAGLRLVTATTDVHEHGKTLVDRTLAGLGVTVIEGGISTDPDDLAALAAEEEADAIAVSTYNGVALRYLRELKAALAARGREVPVLIGGRLNEIPDGSNSSLPTDVGGVLEEEGAVVCRAIDDLPRSLAALVARRGERR